MKNLFYSFLFIFQSPALVIATNKPACGSIFGYDSSHTLMKLERELYFERPDLSLLEENTTYRVVIQGKNQLQVLNYLGKRFESSNEKTYHRFSIEDSLVNKGVEEFEVAESEIRDYASYSILTEPKGLKKIPSIVLNKYMAFVQFMLKIHGVAQNMFKPMIREKAILGNDGKTQFEILKSPLTSKDLGQFISGNISSYKNSLENRGFKFPKKLQVQINGDPILPGIEGSFSLNLPMVNVWVGGGPAPLINLSPILWIKSSIYSASSLYHELTHAALRSTYSPEAWVNNSKMIQEGLADYFAATETNSPQYGFGKKGSVFSLVRDIYHRQNSNFGKSTIHTLRLTDLRPTTEGHTKSLFASNLMWTLREALNESIEMKGFEKPIVDNLNAYRNSYIHILENEQRSSAISEVQDSQNIEFMMATVYRTSLIHFKDKALLQAKIVNGLQVYADSIGYSLDQVKQIAEKLTLSDIDYTNKTGFPSDMGKRMQTKTWLYGAGGLLLDGYLIFKLFIE